MITTNKQSAIDRRTEVRPGHEVSIYPARRILFVTHRVPYPPDKGDRIRTYHLIRFLSQHHRIYLASLADEPVSQEAQNALEQLCEEIAIVPVSKLRWFRAALSLNLGKPASMGAFQSNRLVKILKDWQARYSFDIALASASSIAWYLRNPFLVKVPAIVDIVDVDSEKWLDYSRTSKCPKSWLYRREGQALRRVEQEITLWADHVLLVSEAETKLFKQIAPKANAATITNGVDLDYFSATEQVANKDFCVFVGALDYRPNVDAAVWFCQEIWPRIRAKKQNVEFHLIGRNPRASILDLAKIPGVKVIGQVPDVRPYVREAVVVVAPLRMARGLQNKVLEAMAMGKPVIASPQACAGLKPSVPSPVVQARSPGDWESTLLKVLSNHGQAAALGRLSRLYVEEHYCWEKCLEPLLDRIETVCDEKKKPKEEKKRDESALVSS